MKTSIYLPGDLAAQAKTHGISISEVSRKALQRAVRDAEIRVEPSEYDDTEFVARMLINGLSGEQVLELARVLTDMSATSSPLALAPEESK